MESDIPAQKLGRQVENKVKSTMTIKRTSPNNTFPVYIFRQIMFLSGILTARTFYFKTSNENLCLLCEVSARRGRDPSLVMYLQWQTV